MPTAQEFDYQRAFVIWLDGFKDKRTGEWRQLPALAPDVVYWHTPNGGTRRDGFEAKRFKEMGLKAGIPDLYFLRPTNFPGLGVIGQLFAMEWKKLDEGRLNKAQEQMHPRLMRAGLADLIVVDNLAEAKAWAVRNFLAVQC